MSELKRTRVILMSFVLFSTFCLGCINNKNIKEHIIVKCDTLKLYQLDRIADSILLQPNNTQLNQKFFDLFPNNFEEFKCLYGYDGFYNGSTTKLKNNIGTTYAEKHIVTIFSNLKVDNRDYIEKLLNLSTNASWQPDAVNYLRHTLKNCIKSLNEGYDLTLRFLSKKSFKEVKSFWIFYYTQEEPVIKDANLNKYETNFSKIIKIHDQVVDSLFKASNY